MDISNAMSNYQRAAGDTQKAAGDTKKATAGTQKVGNQKSDTQDSYDMGMQQFISLMIAQLKNQDMMNPTSDTEFVSQMAQFSTLQAVSNLEEGVKAMQATSMTAYATSLMGKNVVVATIGGDNKVDTIEGVVTGVTLFEGQPVIYIGDKGYSLSQIMVVGDAGPQNKPQPDDKPDNTLPGDLTKPWTPLEPSTPKDPKDPKDPVV